MAEPIDIDDLGAYGLNVDLDATKRQPGMFTFVSNVRIENGYIANFPGWEVICEGELTFAKPYYLQPIQTEDTYYWVAAGLNDLDAEEICITEGISKTDVLPVNNFVITPNDQWTGGFSEGISILNNGATNPPIYLDGLGGPTPRYEDLIYDLDAGSTWRTENITCNIMRPFKNFWVAFDIQRTNERYPYLVKWSAPADPGLLPRSWDETNPGNLAGEASVAEEGGYIVEFKSLGDLGLIYKEGSVWSMSLVQSDKVFRFRQVFPSVGCLAPNCVEEFRGKHIVLGDGDVILHNGQTTKSIIEKKIQKYLFRVLDTTYYKSSFIVRHDNKSEIWVCIPTTGNTLPDIAVVWNWNDDTWTVRDLPSQTAWVVPAVDITGQNLPTEEPWDGLLPFIAWDEPDGKIWLDRAFNPVLRTLVAVGETGITRQDRGILYGGEARRCVAERRGLAFAGHEQGTIVRRVYPVMEGNGPVQFYCGSQKTPDGPVSWEGPRSFTPGVSKFVNFRRNGKLIAWRVESQGDVSWELSALKFDLTETGRQ